MIKVLIVAGAMNMGGIENQLMHLARKADKSEFQIDFTTTEEHPFFMDEIQNLGGECVRIKGTNGFRFIRYCKSLFKVIQSGNYDIVHSHELFHSGLVLLTARLAGIKVRIVHAHNWTDMNSLTAKRPIRRTVYNAFMRKLILQNATEFCACSSYAGRFLYGDKVTHQPNYHIVFNSVDTDKYLNNYSDGKSFFPNDGWVNILHVGRMCEQKDQFFIVEIAKEIREQNKKIRILCAGDDSNNYGKMVKSRITEEHLEDYIVLLGIRNDIDQLFRACSAFILPSQFEGMPLVLIEAQASGIQSVCADTFSHEVDFGLNTIKWLDKATNPEIWVNEIEKAIKKERATKSDIAAAIEKNGYSSQSFTDKMCDLYKKAISV